MLRAAKEWIDRDIKSIGEASSKQFLKDAENGYIIGLKALLPIMTNLDPVDGDHNTPFLLAAANGHASATELLLNYTSTRCRPIDVQHRNRDGNTALHLACIGRHTSVVKLLLKYRQVIEDVNAVNKEGNTALHCAAIVGHKSAIDLLARTPGINFKIVNKKYKTPRHMAKLNGNKTISEDLHKFASADGPSCKIM
ncbi:Serine/threonine-protein phosphatase 6 regulatory ankyrin repeat subunit B [Trichoplax sp. H2]|nr:Serine/threonine-protein phosphatase 6 regulatory ankyrin repeat subunit B [Trichoplax sp. H2]|eukprot:RDD43062.1 Serine/threonine-protein phosphatase 6 regulatory ankyrin repeat subunit B [Trichoplax sp. H2]